MMNERIKQLAITSELVYEDEGKLHSRWLEHVDLTEYLEKFAQLIVKECAEVAGCNGHVSGFSLGDLIKQHFGVSE